MRIWFDMDGTIVNLYGEKNWLDDLRNARVAPYINAKPLGNMSYLARLLNKAIRKGHKVCVISWTMKGGKTEYNEEVAKAKKEWLGRHLKSVKFDCIDIVEYGTPKEVGRNGILFDDEENNRKNWGENAYEPKDIYEVLKKI